MSEINFTITDAALIPDELCDVTVTMSAELWRTLSKHVYECDHTGEFDGQFYEIMPSRTPSNERIRAALVQPCPVCKGEGWILDNTFPDDGEVRAHCEWCRGTKTASVPGCRLEMQVKCQRCDGEGRIITSNPIRMSAAAIEYGLMQEQIVCPECHGTKTASVPGVRPERLPDAGGKS